MKSKTSIIFFLILLNLSCSSEENINDSNPNSAPEAFILVEIPDNETNVALFPLFSWTTANDADGDEVNYSLMLEKDSDPTTIIAQNIKSNNYTVTESLEKCTTYFWRVRAEDSNGGVTVSDIFSFNTLAADFTKVRVSANADFSKRKGHTTSVYNNKLWVIGGDIGALNKTNDVWTSENGISWTQINENPPFEPRSEHSSLVFDDKLWMIAGRTSGNSNNIDRNDIWTTTNGVDWTEVSSSANFSKRFGQGAAVFNNKMWIIGGFDREFRNDVWSSEDGVTWSEATSSAAFQGRVSHSVVVLNNKLWVIGGRDAEGNRKNDVWSSEDGITWVEVNNNAPFIGRSLHASTIFCDKIWIIGGANGSDWRNDVWFSKNGENWIQVDDQIPFIGRHSHTATIFKNQIWIIGGLGSDYELKNEIFAF